MLKVIAVLNGGDDILIVRGIDPAQTPPAGWDSLTYGPWLPTVVEAHGWVSATTNHYDPADVGKDGLPQPGATRRPMTAAEIGAYASSLLNPPTMVDALPITFSVAG